MREVILGLGIVFFAIGGAVEARTASDRLGGFVQVMPGLDVTERAQLTGALVRAFAGVSGLSDTHFRAVQGVLSAGLFELSVGEADGPIHATDLDLVSRVARTAYEAMAAGAEARLVEDLAPVGLGRNVTARQLEAAARALGRFRESGIQPDVYQEVVTQALENGWTFRVTEQVADGLVRGVQEGLPAQKLALGLMVGVAKDPLGREVDRVVREALAFVRTKRDPAYEAMARAVRAGLAPPVGREIYTLARSEGWPVPAIEGMFDGLVRGQKLGLTPEKLATALILRLARGLGTVPVAQAVREEIAYVSRLEQDRLEQIRSHPELQRAYAMGTPWRSVPDTLAPKLSRVFRSFLEASIQDYLGTPYQWGGTSKKRGVDCSGFIQGIFREQGVAISRVSRDQYRHAPVKIGERQDLAYGDLVFFNKNGGKDGYITHVGLYLGKDNRGVERFIHSASKRGVVVSRFNKRYYRTRFVGGARVAELL